MIDLRVFGTLDLRRRNGPVLQSVMVQPKRLALLCYLALAHPRRFHRRDTLLALFWPEHDTEHARASLRQSVHILRRSLGEQAICSRGDEELGLGEGVLWCDAPEFEAALAAGELERALALYAGDLLTGFFIDGAPDFERWLDGERARLRERALKACWELAEASDPAIAAGWGRRALALGPTHEGQLLRLMQLLARGGDRAGALAAFEAHARQLWAELQIEPSAAARSLAQELRQQAATAPVTVVAGTPQPAPVRDHSSSVALAPGARRAPAAGDLPSSAGPAAAEQEPTAASDLTLSEHPAPMLPLSSPGQDLGAGARRGGGGHWRRRLVYLAALALLTVAGYAIYALVGGRARDSQGTSLAVLAFDNLSRDPENEYLSDGIADDLLNELTRVPSLRVAARTSSFFFKGKNLPVPEIARRLHVGAVLEGSVQRADGRVRITARLVSARTGYELWSGKYDRDARDLFALEDEISRGIAAALKARLAPTAPARRHVPEPGAHDLYLRGRFLLNRGSRADLEHAVALFRQAIARDSAYPEPYAAAATAWFQLADVYVAPVTAYAQAESMAQRALALDDSNAEAHANLGYARKVLRWDWPGARREFQRALELNPNDAAAHDMYGEYLVVLGDWRASLAQYREAARLEPFSLYYVTNMALGWLRVSERDSALAAYERAQEIAPGSASASNLGGAVFRARGRYAEALALDEAAAKARGMPTLELVYALVALGRRTEAEAALREMVAQSRRRYVIPEAIARAALALGHREQALDWLERGVEVRSVWVAQLPHAPEYAPLRSDPRFQRLLHTVGLDTLGR